MTAWSCQEVCHRRLTSDAADQNAETAQILGFCLARSPGVTTFKVKTKEQLARCDGLVLPGGLPHIHMASDRAAQGAQTAQFREHAASLHQECQVVN